MTAIVTRALVAVWLLAPIAAAGPVPATGRAVTGALAMLPLLAACGPREERESAQPESEVPGCDVSTREGAIAVYRRLTRSTESTGALEACLSLHPEFPGLAYVGYPIPDADCDMTMIWQCRKGSDADVPAILQAAGWKEGDDARRMKIARDWLGVQHGRVLWEESEDVRKQFAGAGKTFSPAVITARDGGVHVEGWVEETHGSIAGPRTTFRPFAADFSADGKFVERVGGEEFERSGR